MLNVLVGCESSGVVRDAFRARGFNAWSCDLLPCKGDPTYHVQGDVRALLRPGCWDLFICHPDCTYLTNSAAWAMGDGPYHQRVKPGTLVGRTRRKAREDALAFVRDMMAAPVPHIAIENPPGAISTSIRAADQYIQPYEFGADASKRTGLWLTGLPPLRPTEAVYPRWVCCGSTLPEGVGKYGCPSCLGEGPARPRWGNQTNSGQNRLPPSVDRWQARAQTYPGVAAAMADQWGRFVHEGRRGP